MMRAPDCVRRRNVFVGWLKRWRAALPDNCLGLLNAGRHSRSALPANPIGDRKLERIGRGAPRFKLERSHTDVYHTGLHPPNVSHLLGALYHSV